MKHANKSCTHCRFLLRVSFQEPEWTWCGKQITLAAREKQRLSGSLRKGWRERKRKRDTQIDELKIDIPRDMQLGATRGMIAGQPRDGIVKVAMTFEPRSTPSNRIPSDDPLAYAILIPHVGLQVLLAGRLTSWPVSAARAIQRSSRDSLSACWSLPFAGAPQSCASPLNAGLGVGEKRPRWNARCTLVVCYAVFWTSCRILSVIRTVSYRDSHAPSCLSVTLLATNESHHRGDGTVTVATRCMLIFSLLSRYL